MYNRYIRNDNGSYTRIPEETFSGGPSPGGPPPGGPPPGGPPSGGPPPGGPPSGEPPPGGPSPGGPPSGGPPPEGPSSGGPLPVGRFMEDHPLEGRLLEITRTAASDTMVRPPAGGRRMGLPASCGTCWISSTWIMWTRGTFFCWCCCSFFFERTRMRSCWWPWDCC